MTTFDILKLVSDLIAKADLQYRQYGASCDQAHLWYRPSTENDAGDLEVAAECPKGYLLVAPIPRDMTYTRFSYWARCLVNRLPILPYGGTK